MVQGVADRPPATYRNVVGGRKRTSRHSLSPVERAILADYPVYFKPRVFATQFFSINSCKKISAPHVFAMIGSAEIVKRSVRIAGHATSVSLEPAFWEALNNVAARRRMSLNALLSMIDAGRRGNLSSAIRLFVLASCRNGELDDSAGTRPVTSAGIGGEDVRRAGRADVQQGSGDGLGH